MSFALDVGVFILVALVGCIHATYLLSRRYQGQFRPSILFGGLGLLALEAAVLWPTSTHPGPDSPPVSLWVWGVPLVCGIWISVRAPTVTLSISALAGALIVSLGLVSAALALHPGHTSSVFSREGFDDRKALSGFPLAYDLVIRMKAPVRPGFLGPGDAPGIEGVTLEQEAPAWHTSITGIPLKTVRPYRVWTPGGAPKAAAEGLRLVLPGDPEPR